ncbi:hypothetical protein BBF96_12815 [Anoxybacter fermentans]|uniref:Transposase n=1 Tax=Anoxybacter fermentans TaxID=1323375 RepID=A0A3Q9HS53_9FIRM|nr:ISL3 family transposase [Anoxybacter fermentans]AZR74040.1 hypothetical protein BBF96_11930 [Anoxybacter fermentans]AZR74202.1 hypothetical protein BBF96_12815 [Anoxybacter fermentans]
MQYNNIIKFLDLPDIIATEIISTEDRYIFIAEAKKNHIVCPQCGNITNKIHDTKWQNIRDIPIRGKLVIIRLLKKRYRCPYCHKRGIPEKYESIDKYARKTKRFDKYLAKETVSKDYSKVARENGLSYTAVNNAVKKVVDPLIKQQVSKLSQLKAISIDEFAVLKRHKYGVSITDPINRELIDILPTRKKDDLIDYFNCWEDEQRRQIQSISMDMWRPFKAVANAAFTHAKIVIDKFHLVTLMNRALDEVRKQVQQTVNNHQRRKFFQSRLLLQKRAEELTDEEHEKLIKLFELSPALEKAWELKEEFRDLLQLDDVKEATRALKRWYKEVIKSKLMPFYQVKKIIQRWEEKILNYFKTKITNGFAEGINNKIKLIKRIGYGVPNVMNLRRRVFNAMLSY